MTGAQVLVAAIFAGLMLFGLSRPVGNNNLEAEQSRRSRAYVLGIAAFWGLCAAINWSVL